MIRTLLATGLLALGGGAQAALIDLEFDAAIGSANFFQAGGIQFFQVGQNLTFSPSGAVALNDGDTARVTFNFAAGQAVRVTNDPASPIETAIGFLTAGGLVNPGPSTQIDVSFDFTLTFLGASGDLPLSSFFNFDVTSFLRAPGNRRPRSGLAPRPSAAPRALATKH